MTYLCCGRVRDHIDINEGGSALSFTLCTLCSASSWLRDGVTIELGVEEQAQVFRRQTVAAFS